LDRFKGGRRGGHTRVVVFGLDGVPCTMLNGLMDRGVMPNLAALRSSGRYLQMDAPVPEVSSVSWTAFMTGKNPGENGIFGFMDLEPASYRMYFPNSRHIKSPTLWQQLGTLGRRAAVLNLPSTYPATELNGVMVSGFVALDLAKASYPPSIVPTLQQMGYRIDVDTQKGRESAEVLLQEVNATLDARCKAIEHFWNTEEWDLFLAIITETDRLQHFLWTTYEDSSAPLHDAVIDFYRRVDAFLGGMIDRVRSRTAPTRLLLLSDHGFTAIRSEVYLSRWLAEEGFLKLTNGARNLEGVGADTAAFALDPSRIYINVRGKYPRGGVEPGGEYERLRDTLAERLATLRFENQPVVRAVLRKEDVYRGPWLERAPDLVVLANHGFDLKGALGKPSVFGRSHLTGGHTQDDAFLYADGDLAAPARPQVSDVAGLILSAFDAT